MEPEEISVHTSDKLKGAHLKLLCSWCRRRTNHVVIQSVTDDWHMPEVGITGQINWLIVQCMGCDALSFCQQSYDSDDVDLAGNGFVPRVTSKQYPPTQIELQKITRFYSTPKEIHEAYEETYTALCSGMPKLGTAGARLIIELVCLKNEIKTGTLEQKIDKLHSNGVVTMAMKELLHNVRLFGNKGLHTTNTPDLFDLINAWNAINTLLDAIYGTQDSNRQYNPVKTEF